MAYWLPREIDLLTELWAKGLTASEIAEAMGPDFTRNAVIGKAHRLGLPARPSPIGRVPPGWVGTARKRYVPPPHRVEN